MASADAEPKQRGRRRSANGSSRAAATKTTKKNSGAEASQSSKRRTRAKVSRRGAGTLAEYLSGRSNVRLNSEQCRAVN
uniref:Capsid protein n=1 Tax=Globodera pallida TaxID=36090 RepID=A0A183CG78_GLOPA